ncbi:MAG: site-specific integrase [Prevotella sp.]|nr:site-specific integrase [Prevotella sp.]
MNQVFIEELLQTCLEQFKVLDFKESTIKRHQRSFNHLRDYMGLQGLTVYNEQVGEEYYSEVMSKGGWQKDVQYSINFLNDVLNQVPIRKKHIRAKNYPLAGAFGSPILEFLDHYSSECRPSSHTFQMYMAALSHFSIRMHQDNVHPSNLGTMDINRFMASLQNTQLYVIQPLRRFLRYLFEQSISNVDLSAPLFGTRSHRPEKLPSVYTTEEIRRMDTSVDKSSPTGKRNYAIFLLASRLGLRASDIRLLQFQNIDWDDNTINFRQHKTQNDIQLPLLSIIGEAIIDYIRNARPKSDEHTVFLTATAPYTPISVPGISSIISNIILTAGIDTKERHHGSHCLRHSLATRMLEQGTTMPVISQALGHVNTESTMVYLNVDVKSLLSCSLDVPPVPECFYMQKGGLFYE